MAYAVLIALAALDAAGYGMIAPVVPQIADETGTGAATLGVLVACFGLGQVVGYPPAGRLVQRRSARVVLFVSVAIMAVGDLAFVLTDSLGPYFGGRFLQGVGAGGLWMGVTFGVLERYPGQEYRRLTGLLAGYSVGGIAGPALGGAGGIRAPFLIHLALVAAAAVAVALLPAARDRPAFGSDRSVLRTRGFRLASAGVLLLAAGYGTIDGPLPLHFASELAQAEIAALYVGGSIAVGLSAVAAGRLAPRAALIGGAVLIVVGLAAAGATGAVPLWIGAFAFAAVGFGLGEAGALGTLLETVGAERIVLAMVVWSQIWALGYLAGPAAAGAVAETIGYSAVGVVPGAAALLVIIALLATRAPAGGTAAAPTPPRRPV
jgi:MFS family permease